MAAQKSTTLNWSEILKYDNLAYTQACQELGPGASMSRRLERAQEIKQEMKWVESGSAVVLCMVAGFFSGCVLWEILHYAQWLLMALGVKFN